MSIDPDELNASIRKRELQIQNIQKYMDEQHALDIENATGKMGHREVKPGASIKGEIKGIMDKASNFFKGKPSAGG
jgi:hypothetical protein